MEEKQPTCVDAGEMTYSCTLCGDSYTEQVSASGHVVVVEDEMPPTCSEPGFSMKKYCSTCDEVFLDRVVIGRSAEDIDADEEKLFGYILEEIFMMVA